jgi:Transposase DDE domain
MGTHRTVAAAAQTSALTVSRAQATRQSRSTDGHPVHPPDRSALGSATTRNGLWQRYELLAPPSRLAGSWRVGRTARSAACALACGRPNRLVPGRRRLLFNPSDRRWSKTGPNPTDRARPGSKHHLIIEAQGIPLAVILTGANRNDVTQLHALVDAIPPIGGKRGRPLSKPRVVQGDRGTTNIAVRCMLPALQLK